MNKCTIYIAKSEYERYEHIELISTDLKFFLDEVGKLILKGVFTYDPCLNYPTREYSCEMFLAEAHSCYVKEKYNIENNNYIDLQGSSMFHCLSESIIGGSISSYKNELPNDEVDED